QRKIVEGVAKKVLSLNGVSNYQSVLNALESNMKTDMSFDEMKKITLDYREAFGKIKQDQLQGEGFMQDNISYQKVSDQELDRVKKELKDQMNLENK
ncbi:TPA: transcriptional regulator, partial [Streptococcus pneumoniae]